MLARAALMAALSFASFAGQAAVAQEAPHSVIVIDQERLFEESLFGRRIIAELEARSAALATENRAIEAELVAEERELTERRDELPPEEFRALADAFDEKVGRLRSEQDAKTRELVTIRDSGRQNFTRSVGPILLDYMRRSGASVMLDRRSVVVTADRVDATDELLAEIDEMVAEGDLPVVPPGDERDGRVAPAARNGDEPLSMPEIGAPPGAPPADAPPRPSDIVE